MPKKQKITPEQNVEWVAVPLDTVLAWLATLRAEQPTASPALAEQSPMHYNDLDTFLKQSSFAWHAELASRKWLEQGARVAGQLNTPRTTAWMAVLGHLNPPLNPQEPYGISPTAEPEIRILRAYQLLLSGLTPEQVARHLAEHPLPDTLADFLVNG